MMKNLKSLKMMNSTKKSILIQRVLKQTMLMILKLTTEFLKPMKFRKKQRAFRSRQRKKIMVTFLKIPILLQAKSLKKIHRNLMLKMTKNSTFLKMMITTKMTHLIHQKARKMQ